MQNLPWSSLRQNTAKHRRRCSCAARCQDGVAVIPKSVHTERIQENIDMFDFELTDAEMSALRSLDKAAPMIGNAEKPELVEMAMCW